MARETNTFALGQRVALLTLDGGTLTVHVDELRFDRDEQGSAVTLRVTVPHPIYLEVLARGWFNTSPWVGVPPVAKEKTCGPVRLRTTLWPWPRSIVPAVAPPA